MIATKKIDVPESKIRDEGIRALVDRLGVTGTIKFLEQFDKGGNGDFTKEKYDVEEPEVSTVEDILKMFE